jgi:hypothetical protein
LIAVSENVLAFGLLLVTCVLVIGLVVFSERGRGDDEEEEYEEEVVVAEEKKKPKAGDVKPIKSKVKAKAD